MFKTYNQAKTNDIIQLYDVESNDLKANMDYCPISVKDEKNAPAYNNFDNMNNTQLFLSKRNINHMIYAIISLNKLNKTLPNINLLKNQIPNIMHAWAMQTKINNSENVTGDIVQTLEFLNNNFLITHEKLYNRSETDSLNVFRIKDSVTDNCGRESIKKYDEMTAADYHTLNVWNNNNNNTYTSNKIHRDGNRIPVWQKSMNTRHYDVDNDGLHSSESDRASLNTQSRGYDMSNIVKGSTNYENYYYENI